MVSDRSVTATFELAQVRNKSTGSNYATLDTALSAAGSGNELLLQGMLYNGAVSLSSSVLLNGGWDMAFGARSGTLTSLHDGLTVIAGDSKLENVTVMGGLSIKGGSLRVKDVVVQP
jgi:hypothetical protein